MNWRRIYKESVLSCDSIGYSNPSSVEFSSGAQTPREMKEEQWRAEADPGRIQDKRELREMYKELGGRKPRAKGKLPAGVGGGGHRDRGGWGNHDQGDF